MDLSPDARAAACAAVCRMLDGGTLALYFGSVRLANLRLPSPAFDVTPDGVATLRTMEAGTVDANGRAERFDLLAPDGTLVLTGTVGEKGEPGDMRLNSAVVKAGGRLEIGDVILEY